MLRTVLIGAGDIKFHYFELLKISEEKFYEEVEKIGKTLAESGCEIVLLPDREFALKWQNFIS